MTIEPLKHQNAAINMIRMHPEIPYVSLIGGFGAGKSMTDVFLCLFLYSCYGKHPTPITIGVLGVTIKLLKQTVIADLERFLDSAGIPYRDNSQAGTLTVGSITFVYLAMQDPDDIYAFNFHAAICDEIDEVPAGRVKKIVTAIQERCRAVIPASLNGVMPEREPFIFFSTTAQGLGGMYMLVKEFQNKGIPHAIIRGRTQDNTHLAPSQIKLLRQLYTKDEARAYLDGEFINLSDGRVYPEFDARRHVSMAFPVRDDDVIYVGCDFNAGLNAHCCIIDRGGRLFIVSCGHWNYVGEGPRKLREAFLTNRIIMIPDVNGKEIMSGFMEEVEEADIELFWNNVNPPVLERITAINRLFRSDKLSIFTPEGDEGRNRMIMGFETRDFDDMGKPRKGKGIDAPDHLNDSCFAAGTEIYTLRGAIPIESVQAGDWVLAHDGTWSLVKWAGKTGKKQVIHKAGLTGTPSHPIMRNKKEIAFIDACEYTILNREVFIWLKNVYLMELSIVGILTRLETVTGNISEQDQAIRCLKELISCIETSGNIITGLFPKVMWCITKTMIRGIIESKIWNAYRRMSIVSFMLRTIRMHVHRSMLTRWRLPGTGPLRVTHGISAILLNTCDNVLSAVKNLLHCPVRVADINTTRETAKAKNSVPAPVLENTTAPCEVDVYNLSLIGTHTFFANGRAVHNCEYSVWHIIHNIQGYDVILDAIRAVHHHNDFLQTHK